MKKFYLSSFIIVSFMLYSLGQGFGKDENPVIAPKTFPNNNQPSLSNSPTSSPADSGSLQTSSNPPPTTSTPTNIPSTTGMYKDGEYTGDSVDAYYGNVQVKVVVSNGRISDVQFLNYPQDRNTSREINSQAMPLLKQEVIQTQSSSVDIVSGATATSQAFIQSLQSALSKA